MVIGSLNRATINVKYVLSVALPEHGLWIHLAASIWNAPRIGGIYDLIQKFPLTIVWNPREFHLIKVLENDRKFNAVYFRAETLSSLSEWRSAEVDGNERKLIMHADNVYLHIAKVLTQFFKKNRTKPVRYPLYSPDVLPPTSVCSASSREAWSVSDLMAQSNLLKQLKLFSKALKSYHASNLSRVHGSFVEIDSYQWRISWLSYNKQDGRIKFYSAGIERLTIERRTL
jgi:hypothetical protein